MPTIAAIRSRLRDESGMTLVEVLTSALLLVVISLGVTKGIDAASNASGNAKWRTVAAMLAQEDQERMRSFASPHLERYSQTRVETVRGVPFTVESRSTWLADSSGTESCGQEGGDDEASYMRITSTVTWEDMAGARPVVHTSLVAPPNGSFGEQGALLVEVLDRDGGGISGLPVEAEPIGGTGGRLSEVTGAAGCAFFGYLPARNYRVSFGLAGHVDPQGDATVVDDVGVTPGATNRAAFLYDEAGALAVTVLTRRYGQGSDVAAQASHVSVGHSGLATPGTRVFATGAQPSTPTLAGLFPFPSAYSVYSGDCLGAQPTGGDQFATVDPGTTVAATVREVSLYFDGGTNDLSRARVVATGSGCSAEYAGEIGGDGHLAGDGAVPFGDYEACVRRGSGGSARYRRLSLRADAVGGERIDLTSTATSSNPSYGWSRSSCGA